jgi:type II protein arginine methyltransferase
VSSNKQIFVALDLTADDLPEDVLALEKWIGEPVRALCLSTNVFLTNSSGYPVLGKSHQIFFKSLMRFRIHIIIRGKPCHLNRDTLLPYYQYLKHLHAVALKEQCEGLSAGEKQCAPYNDCLQAPLQPLMDNLESQTYETFEQDNTKYDKYEEAVAQALVHMRGVLRIGVREDEGERLQTRAVVVMVVGAGRGPLVAATLSAACSTGTDIRVYAVEKNRNAVVTLRNRCNTHPYAPTYSPVYPIHIHMHALFHSELVSCDQVSGRVLG